MNKYLILIVVLFFVFTGFKTDKPAYSLFDKEGKTAKYEKMMKALEDADIVLFGESHDNPVAHWLQLEVTKDLYESEKEDLVLGAEMFESDVQVVVDEYLSGAISTSSFENESRPWPNYKTDYKPLVEFAKKNKLKFVATNVPRRYASLVNSKGFEGLEGLSAELNCYKSMMNMEGMGSHVTENFPKAQAIKDATMAYFILKNWSKDKLFLHYHGSYHSENFESIYWYLKQANSKLKIVTIHTVSQEDVEELEKENIGKADFTICIDEDMTKTR